MTDPGVDGPGRGRLHHRRWRLLGLLGVAQLMLILDVTVVATALPQMATDLSLSRVAIAAARRTGLPRGREACVPGNEPADEALQ
jgi:hypothetical protein